MAYLLMYFGLNLYAEIKLVLLLMIVNNPTIHIHFMAGSLTTGIH